MKSAWKFLSGSVVTYVLMAACANATRYRTTDGDDGGATIADNGGTLGMVDAGTPERGGTGQAGGAANVTGAGVSGVMAMIVDPVPDAAADEPATDGSRLKAIYLVGTDGSRQLNAGWWWDSERKEECYLAAFSDGSMRCIPSAQGSTGIFFSNSDCTGALFFSSSSSCPGSNAKYALGTATFSSCGGGIAYPALYSLTPTTPAAVYQGNSASCTEVPQASRATYTFYLGSAIPLTAFVSATKQHG